MAKTSKAASSKVDPPNSKDAAKTESTEPVAEETPEPTAPATSGGVKSRGAEDKVKFLNVLVHGDSGVGKTTFCGTLVSSGLKVLYVCFNEDELLTLDQLGLKGYDFWVVKSYPKLWALYLALRANKPGYEALVLDGLADLQQGAKDHELSDGETVGDKFLEQAMKGGIRMQIGNWGNLLEMTRHFIDPLLKLPIHKIVTCVSEPAEDAKTGRLKIYPALQGSLQQLIAAHFSVVGYAYVAHMTGKAHFCLTTQPHESILTKDRTRLCQVQINPQFGSFTDALNGKVRVPNDTEKRLAGALIVKPKATPVIVKSQSSKSGE